MKRSLALILSVMMVFCMIPASLLSALANGPGVGNNSYPNLSLDPATGTPIPETINVDGELNDTGWDRKEWLEVDTATGTWDKGTPRNSNFEYEYQLHRDQTFFYGAYSINVDSIYAGSNCALDSVTVWINDGSADSSYTQKIVVSGIADATADGAAVTLSVSDIDGNVYSDPTSIGNNSTDDYYVYSEASKAIAKATTVDDVNMIVVEFRVRLDNLGEDFRLNYDSNMTAFSSVALSDGSWTESLYSPRLSTSEDRVLTETPDAVWPDGAHEIGESEVMNSDGMADYNNVLPTDINVDGLFTEGTWVGLTDRYTGLNDDGLGWQIDDYRREENYTDGYLNNLDFDKSTTHYPDSSTTITTSKGVSTNNFNGKNIKFKSDVAIQSIDGTDFLQGALVAFSDKADGDYDATKLYIYVEIADSGFNRIGTLRIDLDTSDSVITEATPYGVSTAYFFNQTALTSITNRAYLATGASAIESYKCPSYGTCAAAGRPKIERYLVQAEFRIKLSDLGLTRDTFINNRYQYLIEVTDQPYNYGCGTVTYPLLRESRNSVTAQRLFAQGDWKTAAADRNMTDTAMNGVLSENTWQNLLSADDWFNGMGISNGSGVTSSADYITDGRKSGQYYYEVYADFDYIYGAAIVVAGDGHWAHASDMSSADTFTLWFNDNSPKDGDSYNFAISFWNSGGYWAPDLVSNTQWSVKANYTNTKYNSGMTTGWDVYNKGDAAIAGIEAVVRVLDSTQYNSTTYPVTDSSYPYNAVAIEFKIPVSLVYTDQASGADDYSSAYAFGFYTSFETGGYDTVLNVSGDSTVHPLANNEGAGLYKSTKQYIEVGSYKGWSLNDRVFTPLGMSELEMNKIRSDESNDGWQPGRIVDNFDPDGLLEEVYWNDDEELEIVNGEIGRWAQLPEFNDEFTYGYRAFTGREYFYGAAKIYNGSIEDMTAAEMVELYDTEFTVWFNSCESDEKDSGASSNATHWFTFKVDPSLTEGSVIGGDAIIIATNFEGYDIPVSSTVLETGFDDSGVEEKYIIAKMQYLDGITYVEFMIDLDLINANNANSGSNIDTARNGFEYVVSATSTTASGERLTLYHCEDNKETFWVTGYEDEVFRSSAGVILTSADKINEFEALHAAELAKGTKVNENIDAYIDECYIFAFAPTEYDDVYKITASYIPTSNATSSAPDISDFIATNVGDVPAGGFIYVFHEGYVATETLKGANTSYATGDGVANVKRDFKNGTYFRFFALSLEDDGSYTRNQASYTFCGRGGYAADDGSVDINERPAETQYIPLNQTDTGYNSIPRYEIFTEGDDLSAYCPANGEMWSSKAIEVTYLEDYITEKIYIDGDLGDEGWDENGWIYVDEEVNSNRQTDSQSAFDDNDEDFGYKYQVRTDGEYFYLAAVLDIGMSHQLSNGVTSYTSFRLWTNDGTTSTFTKLFEVYGEKSVWDSNGLNPGADSQRTANLQEDVINHLDSRTHYSSAGTDKAYDIDYLANGLAGGIGNSNGIVVEKATALQKVDGTSGTATEYTITYNHGVRVTEINDAFKHNPAAGGADNRHGGVRTTTHLQYGDSSFYGETVFTEESRYTGVDYNGDMEDDSWTSERYLKEVKLASQHATMVEIEEDGMTKTVVEFRVKLDEIQNPETGEFEYYLMAAASDNGDSNDFCIFYPTVIREVSQDFSKYDRYYMPMWYWSDNSILVNDEYLADIMLKSTYTPVTEIGADNAFATISTDSEGNKYISDGYASGLYDGALTSAIRLGSYYDHDYISRYIHDTTELTNYNNWDYWDVLEMGVLVYPTGSIAADDDDFLYLEQGDGRYDNSKGIMNIEADNIAWEPNADYVNDATKTYLDAKPAGSWYADFENFVFYAAIVVSPQTAIDYENAVKNMKYSYRGYIDFYGNGIYNDYFEGVASDANGNDSMDSYNDYYYTAPGYFSSEFATMLAEQKAGTATHFTSYETDISSYANYKDYYSTSMIRSGAIVEEITAIETYLAAQKNAGGSSSDVSVTGQSGANVYYIAPTTTDSNTERVEYLANSAGYNLVTVETLADAAEANIVVYVDGTTTKVADLESYKSKNLVAVTDNSDVHTELEAAGIANVYNDDVNVLGMLGVAKLTSKLYGSVNVEVSYYGSDESKSVAKAEVDAILAEIGATQNPNNVKTLEVLVLTDDPKDQDSNILATARDNLAGNVPTVVIDMTGEDKLASITDEMHLARLLGFSMMSDTSRAAAVALANGIARYAYLENCADGEISQASHEGFVNSLTYSLVNDIAYGVEYEKEITLTADDFDTDGSYNGFSYNDKIEVATTALKTQAFQLKAEEIMNQINGSSILTYINYGKGSNDNLGYNVLVGTLNSASGNEADFDLIFTSGVNVARESYSKGKTGATYQGYSSNKTITSVWSNDVSTFISAQLNNSGVLNDGVVTDKVWDYVLPDEVSAGTIMFETATHTTTPTVEQLINAGINVNRGINTADHWYAEPLKILSADTTSGSVIMTLDNTYDLSAVRIHLANCSEIYGYSPASLKIYYSDSTTFDDSKYVEAETIDAGNWCGLMNYTYWATADLTGISAKYIKVEVTHSNAYYVLMDEIEVYTSKTSHATQEKTDLIVASYNIGHASHAYSNDTAWGAYYVWDGASGEQLTRPDGSTYYQAAAWLETAASNSSYEAVEYIGQKFATELGAAWASKYTDVVFVQELAQYVGGGSGPWGNCDSAKVFAENAGFEYYNYSASGGSIVHGAESMVTDDALVTTDTPSVGVAVMSKYPIVASGTYQHYANDQVVAWARIKVNGNLVDVYSLHFVGNGSDVYKTNMTRLGLYSGLKHLVENNDNFIIGGDFNERYIYNYGLQNDWNTTLDMSIYNDGAVNSETNAVMDVTEISDNAKTLESHGKAVDNILYSGNITDNREHITAALQSAWGMAEADHAILFDFLTVGSDSN